MAIGPKIKELRTRQNLSLQQLADAVKASHEQGAPSDIDETDAGVWVNVERGHRAPVLWEQVYVQQQGFAVVMLTLEEIDGDTDSDRDAERTAKERFRDRQARWRQ